MFNDDLDLDQCRRLVFHLSRTVWPFMCAHGRCVIKSIVTNLCSFLFERPSLIPLTSVELEKAMKKKPINWSSLA